MRSTIFVLLALVSSPLAAQDLTQQEEQVMRAAVQHVAPSVVRIDTVGGLEQLDDVLLGEGPTSGLIVSADGYIVSSTFSFLSQPSSILATMPGGRRLPARIVARDHSRKLVLLKVDANEPLPVPSEVPTQEIVVGQWSIAVGRTFNIDKPNVSIGIVSARDRIWGKAIQTDAKVSPSNYGGPLVDLRGRVLGVLAPLSPNNQHEMAGSEWYDGGIGFAVPLADINERLSRLKNGEDLYPGLLGVTLKAGDIYSLPAEIAACHPKSPAYQVGLRAGDTIVEVNGLPIARQTQLRHTLGPLYAGEKVRVVAVRGGDRRDVTVELAQQIDPYEHPFLGMLPKRDEPAGQSGVTVRYVYPESAAASAGLRVGDRIKKLGDQEVANSLALRDALAALEPEQEVGVNVERNGEQQSLKVKLGTLPSSFPPTQAADTLPADAPGKTAAASIIKIPEEPNQCVAYVPSSNRQESASGLLLILPPPGEFKQDEFVAQWSALAERYRLIVVAPQARLPNMWLPAETAFIRKVIDHFVSTYTIDRARIVVSGSQASGSMAYLTAFRLRDIVRGVVAVDAAIPILFARPPDNDPIERLAVVVVTYGNSSAKQRVQQNVELLREMKYPVVVEEVEGEPRMLDDGTREEIVCWIDTLDRI